MAAATRSEAIVMKRIAALVLALFIPVAALAANADMDEAAKAAGSWLLLVDAGDYAQSWKIAGTFFQRHVTEVQWQADAKAARDPMGAVVARKVAGVSFATTLPGAPDGRYAVVTFDSKFANKAAATETVAMAMEGGSWKIIGYHVR
jgi:hypothetical protein